MDRKTVLVTGGNSGIGFEASRRLAKDGWQVVIASRDRAASAEAVRRITRDTGNDRVLELGLDLGSPSSVRALAREIEQRALPVQALVCNAGLQSNALRLTADGHESTFAVNHLGHFLLVNLLLDRLRANAPARIVVVASGVHDPKLFTGMPKPEIADMATLAATGGPRAGAFDGRLAYCNSKLCNLWFLYELQRKLDALAATGGPHRITANGFDPGLVPGSGLARDYPAPLRFVWNNVLPALARVVTLVVPNVNPADKAGDALARLVTDPALEQVSGVYFPSHTRWEKAPSSDASYDAGRARELWEASVRMTTLTPAETPLR